jgi:hypothetical protein
MPAQKIGRNDPCFCGSGKKYKFCCMGKAEQAPQASSAPFPTVPETFVLRGLLEQSRLFHAFYGAERPKIAADIHWTNKILMPQGIDVQAIRLPDSALRAIYLRRIPAAPPDALAIAHELLHLVLDAEGFPFIVARSEHQPLAALINSAVQDPLIDARLLRHGFNIGKKIQKDIKAALASLHQAEPPRDRVARAMWVLNYAGQLLECEAAAVDGANEHVEAFTGWFSMRHPAIAAEGEELVADLRHAGYDTPELMRASFERIAQRYGLADDFSINMC